MTDLELAVEKLTEACEELARQEQVRHDDHQGLLVFLMIWFCIVIDVFCLLSCLMVIRP